MTYLSAPRPIAFAHRGGAALWPENTLTAFSGALSLGYRYIETDVHLTRDGEIVIFHDPTLERTTNGCGAIHNRSLKELKRLDAGYRFTAEGRFPFRGKGITIPTLTEALQLSPELRLNIELKPTEEHMALAMWQYIERNGLHDRILIAAADSSSGQRFARLANGRVATSAGAREIITFFAAAHAGLEGLLPIRYQALQVPLHHGPLRVVSSAFVAAAHRRGLHVHVWTIDDEATMRSLIALGVDGIMTDRPDVLARVLGWV